MSARPSDATHVIFWEDASVIRHIVEILIRRVLIVLSVVLPLQRRRVVDAWSDAYVFQLTHSSHRPRLTTLVSIYQHTHISKMKTVFALLAVLASAAAFQSQPAFTRGVVSLNNEEPKM